MKKNAKKWIAVALSLVMAVTLFSTLMTTAETEANVTTVGQFNGQPLLKGTYSRVSSVNSEDTLQVAFYYSDGFFLDGEEGNYSDPALYNEHLATASMALNLQDVPQLFSDIGVTDVVTVEGKTEQAGETANGVILGQKAIGDNGEILVPVAVQFDESKNDWYSNMTVGTEGEHDGFSFAAEAVFASIQSYIETKGLTAAAAAGKLNFWISGYSRTGAIANLTARRLVETYASDESAATSNDVFAYCFEAPKGGRVSEMKLSADKYVSIHNCVNSADPVTYLATEEMGFVRYGVDHYIPGGEAGEVTSASSLWSAVDGQAFAAEYKTYADNAAWTTASAEYKVQRTKMTAQLAAIDSENILLNDSFTVANLALISYALFGGDLIQPTSGVTMTQGQYVQLLLRAIQEWGLYGGPEGDFRTAYAVNTSATATDNKVTAQEALQALIQLFFCKSAEESAGMQAAFSDFTNRMDSKTLLNLYKDLMCSWCSLTQEQRDAYAVQMWNILIEQDGPEGKSVEDFLTTDEKTELQRVWYTVLDILLRTVTADNKYAMSSWATSGAMDSTVKVNLSEGIGTFSSAKSLVLLGTFLYNKEAVVQAHYPEINLAWLRSYDNLYINDTAQVPQKESTTTATKTTETTADRDAPVMLLGDCNADGAVNMKDVLVLRKHLASMPVEITLANADVNADGAVNMKDVLVLRKYLAGVDDTMRPAG